MTDLRLKLTTFNCRGFKRGNIGFINELLANCDLFFIQEHLQTEGQLPCEDSSNSGQLDEFNLQLSHIGYLIETFSTARGVLGVGGDFIITC